MSFKGSILQQMGIFHVYLHQSRRPLGGGKHTVCFQRKNWNHGHIWSFGMVLIWCIDHALSFALDLHALVYCLRIDHGLLKLLVWFPSSYLPSFFLVISTYHVPPTNKRLIVSLSTHIFVGLDISILVTTICFVNFILLFFLQCLNLTMGFLIWSI